MILHNSHLTEFRQPFGALLYGSTLTLSIQTSESWQGANVTLRLWQNSRSELLFVMSADAEGIFHTVTIDTTALALEPLWYYFIIEKDEQKIFYGNNQEQLGGIGSTSQMQPPSYQVTLYRKQYDLPDWFTQGIIYQIFPDRFYKNPTDNNPPAPRANCLFHSEWSDTPLYVLDANNKEKLDCDYFGGTLKGITKKLPYLQEIGVSVIYLNPIFEAASNHRYNTADYLKIDPILGTNEDFQKLCARAAEYDIHIILDGVFSHTGSDSIYFNKDGNYKSLGAYQSTDSPYYNWFDFEEYPDKYKCWWGVPTLPNTNELHPDFQNFIINQAGSVLKYWLSLGASGWRLDVADELPLPFLHNFYHTLKSTKPDAILIGEVWEDASNKISYGELRNYLDGQTMDSVMNYPLRMIIIDFIMQTNSAEQTAAKLMQLYENYPRHNFYAMMNLIGSHDRPRILSLLGQALDGSKQARQLEGSEMQTAIRRLMLAVTWQMTFPGVPCIYYGDEAGVQGGTDPYNRSCYPWGYEDKELLQYYKTLTQLRLDNKVLTDGDWQIVYAHNGVLAYTRCLDNDKLLIVLNSKTEDVIVNIALTTDKLTNIFDEHDFISGSDKFELYITAFGSKVYILN